MSIVPRLATVFVEQFRQAQAAIQAWGTTSELTCHYEINCKIANLGLLLRILNHLQNNNMFSVRGFFSALALVISGAAHATPISYEFATSWYEGELTGTVSKGYFSYDSDRVVLGQTLETLDFFNDFSFVLKNVRYTENTVNTARISFSETGALSSVVFGSHCYLVPQVDGSEVGTCAAVGFFVNYNAARPLYAAAVPDGSYPYTYLSYSFGTTTTRLLEPGELPAEVPEPNMALLLLSGLGMLAASRLRNKTARR